MNDINKQQPNINEMNSNNNNFTNINDNNKFNINSYTENILKSITDINEIESNDKKIDETSLDK